MGPPYAKEPECKTAFEQNGQVGDLGDGSDFAGSPTGLLHSVTPEQNQGTQDSTGGEVFSGVGATGKEASLKASEGSKVHSFGEAERVQREWESPESMTNKCGDVGPGGTEVFSPEYDDDSNKHKSSSTDSSTKIAGEKGREFLCSGGQSGPRPAAGVPNGFQTTPEYAKAVIEGWERTFGVELGKPFGIHLIGADYMLWLKDRGHGKEIRNPTGYLWAVVTNGDVMKTNWLTWPEREAKKEEQRKLEEKRRKEKEKKHELCRREMARRKEWEELDYRNRAPYYEI